MTLIQTRALGVTRAASLFSGLDLAIARGDRVGLVAANGRGKTTLLRILAGEDAPTAGDVVRARGLVTALVPQTVPEALLDRALRDVLLDALGPEAAETESWRAGIVLDDLAVPPALHERPLRALSGGWQRTALLARAWIVEPDLLLLDEPTNHLDLGRLGLLQRWLDTVARGVPCLIASHNRAFLDAVTNRTLFLRETGSKLFALPFTPARAAIDAHDAAEARRHDGDVAKAEQLRRQAAKLHNIGVNSGSDLLTVKTRQLRDRADRIEAAAQPAHRETSAGTIRLGNAGTHAKALVALEDATVAAPGGGVLIETGRVWIERGERVVLLGANGTGKTSLLRAVAEARDGIRIARSAVLGVSRQDLSQIDGFASPFDAVQRSSDVGDRRARALLAGAGLDVALQEGPVARLSGGQRARLAMLLLRLAAPNLYVLDEPTDHLDVEGQEALEAELRSHGATCLLASHDRAFVRAVGTRFLQIDRGRLREVDGPEPFFAAQMAA